MGLARLGTVILLLSAGVTVTMGFQPEFVPSCIASASRSILISSTKMPLSAQIGRGGEGDGTSSPLPAGVRFRCGRSDDEPIIAFAMLKELMNPLGISSKYFVVAEDTSTGDRLGWAQIRPLGPAGVDPSLLNSRPGSIPMSSSEDEVDDIMWDEFEEDKDADFSGSWWSTLPWTKEYKAAMEASQRRIDRRAELVAREEADRKNNPSLQLWELASVYVVPDRRSEGIGRALVRSVLDQHRDFGRGSEAVYALTLSSTLDWYASNFGFVSVDETAGDLVPKPMAFEVAAGTAITTLMGNQLVCLRLPLETMVKQ